MNKKNVTLAIMSAVLATGLAMSVLGTNTPAFAQSSSAASAGSSDGTAGAATHADENQASSAATAGPNFTLCFAGEQLSTVNPFFIEGAECGSQ